MDEFLKKWLDEQFDSLEKSDHKLTPEEELAMRAALLNSGPIRKIPKKDIDSEE